LNDLLESMLDSDDEDVSLSSRGRRRKARKIEYDSEQVDLQVESQLLLHVLIQDSYQQNHV
jgi:hypothetical protein